MASRNASDIATDILRMVELQWGDEAVKHRTRVKSNYRSGTARTWIAAISASVIVGRFEEGLTAGMAADLKLSVDQVENLARAGRTYLRLRGMMGGNHTYHEFQACWRNLTLSHWVHIGKYLEDDEIPEFDNENAMQYLIDCLHDDITARALAAHLKHKFGRYRGLEWMRGSARWLKDVANLTATLDTPEPVRRAARLLVLRTNRYLKKDEDEEE